MSLLGTEPVLEAGAEVFVSVPDPEQPLGPRKRVPAKVIAPGNSANDPEFFFRGKYGEGYWLDLYQEGQPTTARLLGDEEQDIRGMYIRYFSAAEIDTEQRPRVREMPDAGGWSDEELLNFDTEKYDRRKLRLECPSCGRPIAPLCSPSLEHVDAGWRWVGLDHQEPWSQYIARCPRSKGCGAWFRFLLYTPQ